MMSVVVSKKMEVSGSGASAFRNMAVWEGGYNVCIEVCRTADQCSEKNNAQVQQLKSAATLIPLNLSKSASYKIGRQYIRHLRGAFVSTKQLETLLLICHDLNYIQTERFLDLNSKLNIFSSKLWKYIKYSERKLRNRTKK
ncbi:MAG: four helix bundle protein [Nanoarchaeota archaeon]|nr:four helix bundle protein [Nanoarchaeota archaeon]